MPVKLVKREDASIILEATLVLPFVIVFIILLTSFIRIAIVEIELENAGSETVKQVAHHIYPAVLFHNEVTNNDSQLSTLELIDQSTNLSLLELARGEIETALLAKLFQPLVDGNTNDKIINLCYYQITNVRLPAALGGSGETFALQMRYDLPLQIPFVNKTIAIIKNFEERVWLGSFRDQLPQIEDVLESATEEQDDLFLKIHSISSPVQRGHYVKIILEATPQQTVRIRLTYNSGFIKEVEGMTNEQGTLVKDIIIGGHSNEGEYIATAFLDNLTDNIAFTVLSKANMTAYLGDRKGQVRR